jgi:hypothetical protein
MVEEKNPVDVFIFLPVLAVCVDLFTPYLIWKNILPAQIRWGSHVALAAMIPISVLRMLGFGHIPRSFWFILAVSTLWSFVAISNGQGIVSTIWGVWLLFQFPFVYLFMYLQPELPKRLAEYLRTFCLIVLGLELAAQLLQFAFGVTPGDDLSGIFGKNGTGNALLFDVLVCCVFFGHWIVSRQSKGLLMALSMSVLSSVLGEMKFFSVVITITGLVAVLLYAIKYRAPVKMLIYLALIFITLVSFAFLYNMVIPSADRAPIQSYITNPTQLLDYLNHTESTNREGNIYSDIGRGYAVALGWNSIQKDTITFLFGYGIGSRSESQALGTAGVALTTGDLGLSVGTSLLVIMQEMGFIGLLLLAGFLFWVLITLAHDIGAYPESPAIGLRYALILFSILWPVWLWYATTWTMRVPMLVYWFSMGYVFVESRMAHAQVKNQISRIIMAGG